MELVVISHKFSHQRLVLILILELLLFNLLVDPAVVVLSDDVGDLNVAGDSLCFKLFENLL